jgi:hypothetical protein
MEAEHSDIGRRSNSLPEIAKTMRALYDYKSQGKVNRHGEKDLSFSKGDIVNVLETRGQWLLVECYGEIGLVPGIFVFHLPNSIRMEI